MVTAQLTSTGVGIRNVLIATDFSRRSSFTLNFGLEFSRHYAAQSYIVHVLPLNDFAMAGPEALVAAQDAARRDLLELKQQLKSCSYQEGEDYHLLMAEGDVADTILECARQKQIDLIVLSTHGRSGLTRTLLGSVAERVFRHSTVPVMTIGPGALRPPSVAPRNLLVPVDFTAASEGSLRYAAELAKEHDARITLLHVVSRVPDDALLDVDRVKRGVEQRLAEVAQGISKDVSLRFRAELGKVAPTILDIAGEINADLLVLGVHALPHLLDRMRWQVAYDVVRDAACPVLTVREPA